MNPVLTIFLGALQFFEELLLLLSGGFGTAVDLRADEGVGDGTLGEKITDPVLLVKRQKGLEKGSGSMVGELFR